jgi:hypothetical protein
MMKLPVFKLTVLPLAGVLCLAAANAAQAQMKFTASALGDESVCGDRCPVVIQAQGRITSTSAAEFVAFAKQASGDRRLLNMVLIHSPGGSVLGSMRLGSVFRSLGTTVVVARVQQGGGGGGFFSAPRRTTDSRTGQVIPEGSLTNASCNSACVYAVMGGKKRIVPEQSRMGIHRMQAEQNFGFDPVQGRSVTAISQGSAEQVAALKRYARTMGIDQKLIDIAESIPHEEIKILSPSEVRGFKLGSQKL